MLVGDSSPVTTFSTIKLSSTRVGGLESGRIWNVSSRLLLVLLLTQEGEVKDRSRKMARHDTIMLLDKSATDVIKIANNSLVLDATHWLTGKLRFHNYVSE